ncbi:hypothetical protein Q7P36_009412 [Cladosporium allicinum]
MSTSPAAPFSVKLLGSAQDATMIDLLPAATRTADDDIQVPSVTDGALAFLSKDLFVNRLNDVHNSLWIAGRPMPPRHIGHQIVLSREVIVTEDVELHLVWRAKRIYIKPLPKYTLDEKFWRLYLAENRQDSAETAEQRQKIAYCARGFLLSYCALISYESDFKLAKTLGLLPSSIEWEQWRSWVSEVIARCPYDSVNPRYWYGELRMGRLNKIYRWQKGHFLRGYSRVGAPSVYSEFLSENFAVLAAALGYIVIALTAMQVGLATDHLQKNAVFQDASWVFTVISMIAPLAAAGVILTVLLVMFISNWAKTKQYEAKRSGMMSVQIRRIKSKAKAKGMRAVV